MNYNCKVIACVVGVNSAGVSEESEKVVLFTAKGTTRHVQCSKSMATCLNIFSNVFQTLYESKNSRMDQVKFVEDSL